MIEILRLSHRIRRDPRISTHVALVARAFGADKIYYSGDHDLALEDSVNKIVKQWGSNFQIEYIKDPIKLIKSTKSKNICEEKKKKKWLIIEKFKVKLINS